MSIIVEVGVNTASDTPGLLKKFPDAKYYGFEPTPELYIELQSGYKNSPWYDRMSFIPMAVSDKTGSAKFNIAGQGDWGCSSLNEFSDNIHQQWLNRTDFKFTNSYIVPTIRLDDFLITWRLEKEAIEYLWIDAQGHDMKVLKSLDGFIKNVKAGRLEVAYTVELYKNTDNTLENAEKYLQKYGYQYKVTPDDVGKECNIEFWR